MQDRSDHTHTFDGVEITAGLRIYDYYNAKWGEVTPEQFKPSGDHLGPGGDYFDGWYRVRHDDGSTTLLNGHRMSTVHPKGEPDPNPVPNS